MSRRLLSTHCRVPSSVADNNPYQPTTIPHTCTHQRAPKHHRNNGVDTVLTDDTLTDSHGYYDYYHGYHGKVTDRSYSDDSGSTRLPCHYENDDESCRRLSRNAYSSDRSYGRKGRDKVNPGVHKDVRRVYPQQYVGVEAGMYQEIPPQAMCDNVPARRLPTSRLSDRPQSSMSSGVTSAIVDGCGGKCQTFENVCYFFLQLVFMMGILIGVSLCIAGLVLRKSAARNLQVLVYIGILLAIVSGVLLGIQWNARTAAKKRKLAVRNAKRAPIPLETLHPRSQVQQPLMAVQDGGRVVPQILRPVQPQPDQQGIPWWRRKDIT